MPGFGLQCALCACPWAACRCQPRGWPPRDGVLREDVWLTARAAVVPTTATASAAALRPQPVVPLSVDRSHKPAVGSSPSASGSGRPTGASRVAAPEPPRRQLGWRGGVGRRRRGARAGRAKTPSRGGGRREQVDVAMSDAWSGSPCESLHFFFLIVRVSCPPCLLPASCTLLVVFLVSIRLFSWPVRCDKAPRLPTPPARPQRFAQPRRGPPVNGPGRRQPPRSPHPPRPRARGCPHQPRPPPALPRPRLPRTGPPPPRKRSRAPPG